MVDWKILSIFANVNNKRTRTMKISELKEFEFYIGNTTSDEDELDDISDISELSGVVATNEGIIVDDELVGEYDADEDIESASDFCSVIDDAISNCTALSESDRDELGTYLGADIDIRAWWRENYGDAHEN